MRIIFILMFCILSASSEASPVNHSPEPQISFSGVGGSDVGISVLTSNSQYLLNQELRMQAQKGSSAQIESLIQQGANINSQTQWGESALYFAVQFYHEKAALTLLKLGAKPNVKNEVGKTPLQKAAENCEYRVVSALLDAGARVNDADQMGRTPLMNAAESSCVRAVAVLLTKKKGQIALDLQDHSFRTAADLATHPWIQSMIDTAHGKKPENGSIVPEISLL